MGKPGAKKSDQIVSATPGDVHIIMIPSPGGPVPTPIPHPCASMIKDKVATKVKVMGQPGAVKGSKSKHTPPHIPMGPGPFQKPPKNEGEIITGSANVFYEGKEAAMLGDTGQMCSDPSDTPVGKVMGTAGTVLIGGGGGGSDEAREEASATAMKAAAAACHKWINSNMPPGAEREQAHRDLCTTTGHPIDVATGKLITRAVELEIPGRIPFRFVRNYSSGRPEAGPFGWHWRHSYQLELVVTPEFVAHRDANGRYLPFVPLRSGEKSVNLTGGLVLTRQGNTYFVQDASGRRQVFLPSPDIRISRVSVSAIEDHFGNRIEFDYQDNRLTYIRDSGGRHIKLDYDASGRLARLLLQNPVTREFQMLRQYGYSDTDDLVKVVDPAGHAAYYEYSNHLLVRETDRNGFSFYFSYDASGWCHETWGDGGLLHRRLSYDRVLRRTRIWNSEGNASLFVWNELGLVIAEVDALGNRWTFQYDNDQNRIAAEDPLGNAWLYEYDKAGRLLKRTDPNGNVVELVYDPAGRRTACIDGEGRKWPAEYDAEGRLITLKHPDAHAVAFEWSARGDLVATVDELGRRTTYGYDDAGNVVQRTNHRGALVHRRFSSMGQLLSESDTLGPRAVFEYDKLGRVVREEWRDRGVIQYEHDAEGNVVKTTNQFGVVSHFEYGRFNKLLRRVIHLSRERSEDTKLEYDSENRLASVAYPGGRSAAYGYNADGRIAWKRSVDGRTQRFVRNAAGFVSEIHDDGGLVAVQEHDSLGRVIARQAADGERTSYAFNASGRLASAQNRAGEIAFEYDAFGRVIAESGPHGGLTHEYDCAGRHVRTALGEDFLLNVDRQDEAVIYRTEAGWIKADYDVHGRLEVLNYSNGGSDRFSYGASRKPDVISSRVDEWHYAYDAGRCVAGITSARDVHLDYQRDSHRRLVSARRRGGGKKDCDWRFGYDQQGNRSREGCGFRFGAGNRLESTADETLKYDLRGRVVERRSAQGSPVIYRYSVEGLLLEVVHGGRRVTFRYDALGRRTLKTVDGSETRFLWEGSRLVHEWRPDGEERNYTYRPNSYVPLMCNRRLPGKDWELFFFHNDHRGCPIAVTNGAGELVWRAEVGPFGEIECQEGTFDQPLALPGQYRDVETGLAYNYRRYFDPQLTIFLSPDPLGHLGGDQLYAFPADPLTKVDPLGLSADDYDQTQRTPHKVVEINGVKYVEFDAINGFTSDPNINVGGSGSGPDGSPDSMASIGPDGEVVVMEGRHRAVAAAAGDPIPEHLGGIPDRPGHLRYPLGEGGNFETTDNVGPSLLDLASDPASLDAARSGHPGRRTT